MADMGLETITAPAVNGERDSHPGEPTATILAQEDSLTGRLQIRGAGSVLGTFNGRIECDGDLMIGPEAHVEADVRATRVTIAGYVRGNVVAVARLKIMSSGRLEGDARVGALVVQEGGVHHGVIRVYPEGIPEGSEQAGGEAAPRATVISPRSVGSPVDRVKKFWGEFF